MKEKLIQILGLNPVAEDVEVIQAVTDLVTQAKYQAEKETGENRIRKKIAASGGALNREQAIIALTHQDEAAQQLKKSRK